MHVDIFDIPLIQDNIARHLHPKDLFQALLVCTAWHDAFLPRLWQHLILSSNHANRSFISPSSLTALARHHHLVRSICSPSFGILNSLMTVYQPSDPFHPIAPPPDWLSSLRTLHLSIMSPRWHHTTDRTHTHRLLDFLPRLQALERLSLERLPFHDPEVAQKLQELLRVMCRKSPRQNAGLQYLTIASPHGLQAQCIRTILMGCFHPSSGTEAQDSFTAPMSSLTELTIRGRLDYYQSEPVVEGQIFPRSMLLQRTALKVLQLDLDRCGNSGAYLLADFCRTCPFLEKLLIPDMVLYERAYAPLPMLEKLCSVLKSNCPRLQHVALDYKVPSPRLNAGATAVEASLSESTPASLSISPHVHLLRACSDVGLISFVGLDEHCFLDDALVQELVASHRPHRTVLANLDLKRWQGVKSRHLHTLLSECTQLVHFEVMAPVHRKPVGQLEVRQRRIQGRDAQWIREGPAHGLRTTRWRVPRKKGVALDVRLWDHVDVEWPSTRTLRVLKICFTGLPERERKGTTARARSLSDLSTTAKSVEGSKRLATMIYERLGAMTQLEELHLGYKTLARHLRGSSSSFGHYDERFDDSSSSDGSGAEEDEERDSSASSSYSRAQGGHHVPRPLPLSDFDLTLHSGLGLLSNLKRLEILNLMGMLHGIGQPEVEWIVEHWPRIQRIEGLWLEESGWIATALESVEEQLEARRVPEFVGWLRERKVGIQVSPFVCW